MNLLSLLLFQAGYQVQTKMTDDEQHTDALNTEKCCHMSKAFRETVMEFVKELVLLPRYLLKLHYY